MTAWYDGFGRPVTTLLAMGGHSRYLEHGYDRAGNRTGLTFAHPERSWGEGLPKSQVGGQNLA